MKKILVVGTAVVDFVFRLQEMPKKPEKYRAHDAQIIGGGMAANAAVAIAKLGGQPQLASRLGDDMIGDLIAKDLREFGVDLEYTQHIAGAHSSYSSVYIDANGERQIVNFCGQDLACDGTYLRTIPACDAVLVDTRWVAGAQIALQCAQNWGVPGILDGEPPIDQSLLSLAQYKCLPMQGFRALVGNDDIMEGLRALQKQYGGVVSVSDGANGVFYYDDTAHGHIPAIAVDAVDTNGCGDIWHGAFALSMADGGDTVKAIEFSNAAAACKCRGFGARAACPDHTMVTGLLKENGIA
ncbi:MAG: PfkB family carbohydrate kinase, partial [Pseudomonadota bacterium]